MKEVFSSRKEFIRVTLSDIVVCKLEIRPNRILILKWHRKCFLFYFVIFVCLPHTLLSLKKNLTSNTEIYCLGLSSNIVSTGICKSSMVVIENNSYLTITNRGSATPCDVYIIAAQCLGSWLMNFLTCAIYLACETVHSVSAMTITILNSINMYLNYFNGNKRHILS